jgi:membrane-bound lytic murein transglycosylase D
MASAPKSTQRGDDSMVRKVGYRVRKGDSLSRIANRFAVNVSDIAGWNNLNTSRYLQPGQSLVLYVDIRNSP